LNGSG